MSKIEVNQISSQCGSTLTIGQSGDTVTLACGATQTGFGRTGTVDWCTTAKTAPFTGVSGKGYFVNTTCGAVTVTLPATPTAGDIISIKDYARTAATNNINFCRNGSKMDGVCASTGISTNGDSTTLIYVDGTKGWTSILDNTTTQYGAAYVTATGGTITTCGDYKIHTFTADGCFSVSAVGNPAGSDSVDYIVVAGGGAAGFNDGNSSGGGGAGGYRESHSTPVSGCYTASPLATPTGLPMSPGTYPITVGGGGSVSGSRPVNSTAGSNSVFSTITSTGGGYGGNGAPEAHLPGPGPMYGGNGGSGGGVSGYVSAPKLPVPAGTGNTPPVSPPQGNPGGTMLGQYSSAGGGGATQAGVNSSPGSTLAGTPGGDGATTSISGSPASYAGGGGGAGYSAPGPGAEGDGGLGGGGDGGGVCRGTTTGAAGTANTGGGGGGGGYSPPLGCGNGGAGGSGIVIIRYKFQ
jgi:hypothetical protein